MKIELLEKVGAIEYGDFTLASGRKSNYYIDVKKLLFSSYLTEVCREVYDILESYDFDAIGGPELGVIPLVGGMLTYYSYANGFAVRKTAKDYGLGNVVIGNVKAGDKCVVLEDVTTSGASLLRAVDEVKKVGCEVVCLITVVDRTNEIAAKTEIPFHSLLNLSDFGK